MWDQIRSNQRKSIILVVAMAFLLLAIGWFGGEGFYGPGGGTSGLIIAVIVWILLTLTSYFSGDSIFLSISGARKIKRKDHEVLWNVVEEMKIASGMPKMPAIYIDSVTDMRPAVQREGQGSFFKITYPADEAWVVPPTQIYAEALAQDLEQTHLVELVPLHSQADYILSVDLLSMSCQLNRSPMTSLLVGALGAGLGYVVGGADSHAVKLAVITGLAAVLAVPVPTSNHAEAEVRMTLKDRTGNILWQETCSGEFDAKKYITPTSRQDQELVNENLTKAVKKTNACLLGQLRNRFLQEAVPADQN